MPARRPPEDKQSLAQPLAHGDLSVAHDDSDGGMKTTLGDDALATAEGCLGLW